MYIQTGKTFIATVIAVILSLSGIAVLSSKSHKVAPTSLAQTQTTPEPAAASNDASSNASTEAAPAQSGYEDSYRAGYRDGHQDCMTSEAGATASNTYSGRNRVTRAYYPRRVRVAGARYTAEARRGHSTRNMILTIAGPAAVAAGIGGIVHGGKGAGIGALLGGGGGALYYLAKHRRQ
jgi:hypothetical protein